MSVKQLLLVIAFAWGVSVHAAEKNKVIKLDSAPKFLTVDMTGYTAAKITLPASEGLPEVLTQKGPLADCVYLDTVKVGNQLVIHVNFDADLDDGINSCQVMINERSGRSSMIELWVEVIS